MNRNRINLVVDLLASLAMAGLMATGIVLYYRLPAGSGGNTMLGRTRHEWDDIHFWVAVVLLVLVVLHIVLRWKWVTHTTGALFGGEHRPKPGAGLGGAALLVVLGLLPTGLVAASLAVPVTKGTGGGGRGDGKGNGYRGGRASGAEAGAIPQTARAGSEQGRDDEGSPAVEPTSRPHGKRAADDRDVTGKSTVADAAMEAGVPVARFLAELKLPADTVPTESLGRLRQEHGFALAEVRGLIARLKAERNLDRR
jgi:hypothetical protein